MKKLLGIEIPDDLSALDNDALKALGKSLVAAAKATAAGEVDPTVLAEVTEAQTFATSVKDELAARKAADAELAEQRSAALAAADELEGAFDDEGDAKGEAGEGETDPEGEGGDADPDAADKDGKGDASEGEGETVTAGASYRPTAAAITASGSGSDTPPAPTAPALGRWRASSGIADVEAGSEFESLLDLAEALTDRWGDIKGGSTEKVKVASLKLPGEAFTKLTGDRTKDNALVASPVNEQRNALTAACWGPREQVYETVGAVLSSTARPVKGSLVNYTPERGGVSVFGALKLADIDGDDGYGTWTVADDSDDNAEKVPAILPCKTAVNYDVYGIWRALTVTNMENLTVPELVAAAINKLTALQARMAEVALLDAMLASTNVKNATVTANDFGASINLLSTILNAAAIYREEERIGDQMFDAWLPRWVLPALQIDLLRQRRTSGRLSERLPSAAEVNAALNTAGISPTWTMDVATSWAPVPTFDDGEALPSLPTDIDFFFSPMGNFRALDKGEQEMGVTNSPRRGTVRDNESNSRNRFTIWQESFEGILDNGGTTYAVNISGVCLSGAQTGDVTAITDCAEAS